MDAEEGPFTPEMVLGPPRKGIKLTYTTDTRPTDSIRKNAKDSDLFICEGMYGEKEKAAKAVEYKHMTFYEAAELAKEATGERDAGERAVAYALQPVADQTRTLYGRRKKDFPKCKSRKRRKISRSYV